MSMSGLHGLTKAIAFLLVANFATAGVSRAGVMLTDSSVFSANDFGENWNGWIWNTQVPPGDTHDRWNLYYSSSTNPDSPVFLNSGNGAATNIDFDLTAGTHTFLVYGETVTTNLHELQHFVLNLYFGNNQAAPDISGLYGSVCPSVCAASHWNGLDLDGDSGLGGNLDAQEAGTLLFASDGYTVELSKFTWVVGEKANDMFIDHVDTHDTSPSDVPDFVGEIELRVTAVPEPATMGLIAFGITGILLTMLGSRHRPSVRATRTAAHVAKL